MGGVGECRIAASSGAMNTARPPFAGGGARESAASQGRKPAGAPARVDRPRCAERILLEVGHFTPGA